MLLPRSQPRKSQVLRGASLVASAETSSHLLLLSRKLRSQRRLRRQKLLARKPLLMERKRRGNRGAAGLGATLPQQNVKSLSLSLRLRIARTRRPRTTSLSRRPRMPLLARIVAGIKVVAHVLLDPLMRQSDLSQLKLSQLSLSATTTATGAEELKAVASSSHLRTLLATIKRAEPSLRVAIAQPHVVIHGNASLALPWTTTTWAARLSELLKPVDVEPSPTTTCLHLMEEPVAKALATTVATTIIVTLATKLDKRIATCQTSMPSTVISTSSAISISSASQVPVVAAVTEMDLVQATIQLPDTLSALSS